MSELTNRSVGVSPATAAGGAEFRWTRRHVLALAVLCLAALLDTIDVTVVNVAMPAIRNSLHFSEGGLAWMVDAYMVPFGGFLLLGGRLTDIFGRRRLFIASMAGFTIASVGAALSATPAQLIVCRGAQGLAAAVMSPATLAILSSTFPEGRTRDRAYGIWASAGSLGGIIGFLLGGVMTSAFGWRSIFLVNGPVGIIGIVGGLVWLPREDRARSHLRLDVPGAAAVTAGLALLIYGVGEAEAHGWGSWSTLATIAASAALLTLFARIEARTDEPLLPGRLVWRRGSFANVGLVVLGTVSTSALYLSSLYMQHIYGWSAGQAGAATLSLPAGYAIGANLGSRALSRVGTRRLASVGFAMISVALAWLASTSDGGTYLRTFLPGLGLLGIGLGTALVPSVMTATEGVDPTDHGVSAGMCTMASQLGGATGLAALATVAAASMTGTAGHLHGEAAGIRAAFVAATGIALAGMVIAAFGLPAFVPRAPASTAAAVDPAIDPATLAG